MDVELVGATIDHLGARCESNWLARMRKTKHSGQFFSKGYFAWDLPAHVVVGLRGFFAEEKRTIFSPKDHSKGYFAWKDTWDDKEISLLNNESVYFAPPNPTAVASLENFLDSIKDEIEQQLAYSWTIYNVRAWSVRPGGAYGPNAWHSDGVSLYRRKLMFYLDPPNEHNGSLEFIDRSEQIRVLESKLPQCILFDSGILKHRARPPSSGVRPSIEVTTIPSNQTCTKSVFAGHAALVPKSVDDEIAARLEASQFRHSTASRILREVRRLPHSIKKALHGGREGDKFALSSRRSPIMSSPLSLIVGGGPHFKYDGWINLDPITGPNNRFPIFLNETTVFPIPSGIIQIVYLTDRMRELHNKTLVRILKEARRVIAEHGNLVAKTPLDPGPRSLEEFVRLVEDVGFVVRSAAANEVCARFKNIPHIDAMKGGKFYCHAVPS